MDPPFIMDLDKPLKGSHGRHGKNSNKSGARDFDFAFSRGFRGCFSSVWNTISRGDPTTVRPFTLRSFDISFIAE
jgi:hypothetical protein